MEHKCMCDMCVCSSSTKEFFWNNERAVRLWLDFYSHTVNNDDDMTFKFIEQLNRIVVINIPKVKRILKLKVSFAAVLYFFVFYPWSFVYFCCVTRRTSSTQCLERNEGNKEEEVGTEKEEGGGGQTHTTSLLIFMTLTQMHYRTFKYYFQGSSALHKSLKHHRKKT